MSLSVSQIAMAPQGVSSSLYALPPMAPLLPGRLKASAAIEPMKETVLAAIGGVLPLPSIFHSLMTTYLFRGGELIALRVKRQAGHRIDVAHHRDAEQLPLHHVPQAHRFMSSLADAKILPSGLNAMLVMAPL